MSTYSIGTGITIATKLENLNDVLFGLRDNTSKLITPKDVRNAVYTVWENIMFKPTSNSGGTEYIGIDQSFIQKKILIGKKEVGGNPVLNSNLLNSTDVDVFFFNTKTQSTSLQDTKIAILAGTGSNFQSGQLTAPYFKSTVVNLTNTIDFEIVNPSYYTIGLTNYGGNIVVNSNNGNVVLNGLYWPTFAQNTLGPLQNDYVLKYKWIGAIPYAVWEAPVTASITSLISSGTVSISGNPVVLNGLPINFTDLTPTPIDIGGIPAGSTFSNIPVTEMIRRILYPYIAPQVSASLNYSLWEIGDDVNASSTLEFTYIVLRNATYSMTTPVFNFTPVAPLVPGFYVTGAQIINLVNTYVVRPPFNTGSVMSTTQSYIQFDYSVSLSDTYPTNIAATASIIATIPWYYGTATISATQATGLDNIVTILGTSSSPTLGKLLPVLHEPVLSATSAYNKSVVLSTLGLFASFSNDAYLYFGYPAEFPDIVSIYDQNNYDVTGSFKKFEMIGTGNRVSSPNFIWSNKEYKFYIYVGSATGASDPIPTQIGSPPLYTETYKFNFA